jgi:hypothetical protein
MIISKRVTVGTEAIQLVASDKNWQKVKFVNAGSEIVRIGPDSQVSSTNAFGLARLPDSPNVTRNIWDFDIQPGESKFGELSYSR